MKIRESCLQTGNFIYKPGISLTKTDFHLQRGSLGLQRGFSGYYLPAQKGAIDTAYIYEDHGSKIETKILNKGIINKINAIISTMAYIELSTYPGFDEMYVSHINFTCP